MNINSNINLSTIILYYLIESFLIGATFLQNAICLQQI